jgi:hypothetical protein
MYVATITHDIKSNTLEATWLEEVQDTDGNVVELKRLKSRNYSQEQKDEFETDVENGFKYTALANW